VQEYCEGGDLGAVLKKAKKEGAPLEEEYVWRVFGQLVVALKECHRHRDAASGKLKPVLHRDLKPGKCVRERKRVGRARRCGRAVEARATHVL
jgi:NIMA (never in mitosis gene a)-related kinase 2